MESDSRWRTRPSVSMERKDGGSPPRPGMTSSLRCVALVGWVDHVGARSVILPLSSVPPSTHKQTPTATPTKPRNSNAPRLLGVLGQVEQAVGVVLHDQQVVRLRHRVQLSNGWFGVVGFHVGLTASETAFADPHIHTHAQPRRNTQQRTSRFRARGMLVPVGFCPLGVMYRKAALLLGTRRWVAVSYTHQPPVHR